MDAPEPMRAEGPAKKQPIDLLQSQVDLLSEILNAQHSQQSAIINLQTHVDELTKKMSSLHSKSEEGSFGLFHAKIENVNMPFWSLVGFLLKLSFASIPAAIVIGIIYGLIMFFFAAISF